MQRYALNTQCLVQEEIMSILFRADRTLYNQNEQHYCSSSNSTRNIPFTITSLENQLSNQGTPHLESPSVSLHSDYSTSATNSSTPIHTNILHIGDIDDVDITQL